MGRLKEHSCQESKTKKTDILSDHVNASLSVLLKRGLGPWARSWLLGTVQCGAYINHDFGLDGRIPLLTPSVKHPRSVN